MAVKSGKVIIDALNDVLSGELAAINQYFLHAKMFQDWGFERLYAKVHAESIDEMKHADMLIERILYLDGLPNVQRLGRIRIGENTREMFQSDMAIEQEAIPLLNTYIALCVAEGDNGTRALFESILVSEEEHLDWLEAQLHMMDTIGDAAYLAEQIKA